MSFQSLPNELILQIAYGLFPPDTNALLRTSNHLSVLLTPVLLENSIYSEKHAQGALFHVASREDKKTVRKLLDRGILKSITGHKPLLSRAVHTQSEACIRTLIDCGIDLEAKDIDELTPFGEAVASTRLDIIKIFLDIPDVDVNSRCFYSMTPLHLTLFMEKEKGHAEVLQLLLAHDRVEVDLADESSWTPLSRAAHSGAEWAVRLLLDDGRSSVEHADSQGRTPVHLAAKRGHDKIVKMLLESERAHVNTPDHDGETPLFTAASRGRLRVVNELLADPQIDVNSPDMDDCSPLFVACLKGHDSIVQALLENPMTLVNCTDGHGVTALHVAANAGYDDVVKALLETGDIDVDSKPLQGKSVRMLVRSYPKNVQQILQEYLVSREMGMDVG